MAGDGPKGKRGRGGPARASHGTDSDSRLGAAHAADEGTRRRPAERYWLIHPNGGRQLIDPRQFDLDRLAEQALEIGGKLVVEEDAASSPVEFIAAPVLPEIEPPRELTRAPLRFEPPVSALVPLFRHRLDRVYSCLVGFDVEINTRPTTRVLGGYYKTRRLVRIYSHDRQSGRRPLEELFDTFLHEVAHHIEYTEPDSYHARACERVPGRMHSELFWKILGDLKARWAELQRP
ncbi:MAG: hypothetical protein U0835_06625 [Isosphaeraceae bacterium]